MAGNYDEFVQCPTREPHEMTLITPQIIPRTLCQNRQSEHFHRCPKCVHRCALAEISAKIGVAV